MGLARTLTNQAMFTDQTATTTVAYFPEQFNAQYVEGAVYVTFDHTSAAGTVLVETAPYKAYGGTWVVLGTVTWSAIDKAHLVNFSGIYGIVRVRISSAVTSGTCSAWGILAS